VRRTKKRLQRSSQRANLRWGLRRLVLWLVIHSPHREVTA